MPSTIGTRIRRRRNLAGLSIAALALKTGIDSSQLSKIENTLHKLSSVENVVIICRALNAPLDEVILGSAAAYREKVRLHTAAMEEAYKDVAGEL